MIKAISLTFLFVISASCVLEPEAIEFQRENVLNSQTLENLSFDNLKSHYAGGSIKTIDLVNPSSMTYTSLKIQFALDGVSFSDLQTLDPSDNSFTFNIPLVNQVGSKLKIIAVDNKGNSTQIESSSFEIDSVLPSDAVATLTTGSFSNGDIAVTVSNCVSNEFVLINESMTAPTEGDLAWQDCNTLAGGIEHTFSGAQGARTFYVWRMDQAGNISAGSDSVSLTYDSISPVVNIVALSSYLKNSATDEVISFNFTEVNADSVDNFIIEYFDGSSWQLIANQAIGAGAPFSSETFTQDWSIPSGVNTSNSYVRITVVDQAGNSSTTTSNQFTIDNTKPIFTASSFQLNSGVASTNSTATPASFSATDNLSNITHFCLKANSSIEPELGANCWVDLNDISVTPSTSISVSNYSYILPPIPDSSDIRIWAKDQAGNISANTSTLLTDMKSISYVPGLPPEIKKLVAANVNTASNPITISELNVPLTNSVYIKWEISDPEASLPANPVKIYVTSDEVNFRLVVDNVPNAQGAGCTLDGTETGCYVWTNDESSGTFRVRVSVEDPDLNSTLFSTTFLNTIHTRIIAGDTDNGLGGGATSAAIFDSDSGTAPSFIGKKFVLTSKNDLFYLDDIHGLVKISATDKIYSLYISVTGSFGAEPAPLASAELNYPTKIIRDYQDRLYIFDRDRIRRIDPYATSPILETIIGGGVNTADTIVDPLELQFGNFNNKPHIIQSVTTFDFLPDGKLYFMANHSQLLSAENRIRVFDENQTNKITSLKVTGTGHFINPTQDLSLCTLYSTASQWNFDTSQVDFVMANLNYGCENGSVAFARLNPTTYVSEGPHPPQSNFNFRKIVFSGMDGKIYSYQNQINYTSLMKYNSDSNTWAIVLGDNSDYGVCPDNTPALSCKATFHSVFVDPNGKIYWLERGRIRTINNSNNVVTIYGSGFRSGDGGLATSARFNLISSLHRWDDGGIKKYVIGDSKEFVIREFTIGGNISKVAGTGVGAKPTTGNAATSEPVYNDYNEFYMLVDPLDGSVLLQRTIQELLKINRSNGLLEIFGGVGSGTDYSANSDGLTMDIIRLGPYKSFPIGISPNEIVLGEQDLFANSGTVYHAFKSYDRLDSLRQSTILGDQTSTQGTHICADGSLSSVCQIRPFSTNADTQNSYWVWDEYGDRWIWGQRGKAILKTIENDGTVKDLRQDPGPLDMPRNIESYTIHHDISNNSAYYCATDGRLYKYDLDTNIETALAWDNANMSCVSRSLLMNKAKNGLIFVFTMNNLYGVAEYIF